MHIAGKIAIGVGVLGVAAFALSACATEKEQDPQSRALDDFGKFDKNKDNKWTQNEATRFEVGRPYTTGYSERRVGDWIHWSQQIVHKEHTHSMQKAFQAAKGNDAIASLQELTKLAASFDKDGNGTLNRKEQKAFRAAYGPSTSTRTILDRTESGVKYDPYPDPGYPGGGWPGNGPGDSGGWPGSGGGSNGPGDSGGGYIPPSGGNGPGDSGGGYVPPSNGGGNGGGDSGGYVPPSNGGGSGNGPGDSSNNGNPGYDDF